MTIGSMCDRCGMEMCACDCDRSDDHLDSDYDEELDEYEEALGNCSGFMDDGFFVCGAAGSEDCDWECPFSGDLGKSREELEREAGQEITASSNTSFSEPK